MHVFESYWSAKTHRNSTTLKSMGKLLQLKEDFDTKAVRTLITLYSHQRFGDEKLHSNRDGAQCK